MLTITLDPTGEYSGQFTHRALINDCIGSLGAWILDAPNDVPLKDFMIASYGYGMSSNELEGKVDTDLVYHYPGDSPLAPFAVFVRGGETVAIYPYGFVVFLSGNDAPYMVRMD